MIYLLAVAYQGCFLVSGLMYSAGLAHEFAVLHDKRLSRELGHSGVSTVFKSFSRTVTCTREFDQHIYVLFTGGWT